MAEVIVAKTSDFDDPGRKVFDVDGMEVGVFKLGGEFYAWENRCPHLDGPACQAGSFPKPQRQLTMIAPAGDASFPKRK